MLIRFLDIVLSAIALLILFPVIGLIAIALRVTGEGEIFYRQMRVGKGGAQFGLLKFATMLKDSPNLGTGLITLENDSRVLPAGRFLRTTKLNELPQLFNILVGDMSVIGPRPQAPAHFEVFPQHIKEKLLTVRPGLSGIGSIVFRDEERLLSKAAGDHDRFYRGVIAPYKGELELWFIRRQGVRLYFLLIFLTVLAILFPRNHFYQKLLKDIPSPPTELQELLL